MPVILKRKEAIEFTRLDEKTFDNFFRVADEFPHLPRTGASPFKFDKLVLEKWLEEYRWRTVDLTFEDYTLCLDFALAQHFREYAASDFGTGRLREFGQKITNWVKGQLGEVAVKKFFKREFGVDVELDFALHDGIVPQDVIGVREGKEFRNPRIGIGIKSSKPKNAYLILGSNEITIPSRRSDIYIFCRPDIPDDHLLRITNERIREVVKGQQHYKEYQRKIPEFENIPCEIAGWCFVDELEKVTRIENQEFTGGPRFVKKSGQLHKDKVNWEKLLKRL